MKINIIYKEINSKITFFSCFLWKIQFSICDNIQFFNKTLRKIVYVTFDKSSR